MTPAAGTAPDRRQVAVLQLINAYRFLGVRNASLDPLARHVRPDVPELDPEFYGFTEADMDTTFETGSLVAAQRMTLREVLQLLRQTYCGSIGAEYMYIGDYAQKRWIQERVEGVSVHVAREEQHHILNALNEAEVFERFLHSRYVGQKRFGLEGGESTIVALNRVAAECGRAWGRAAVESHPQESALEIAIRALTEHGYEPRQGDTGVALANCPFHSLASAHTEMVCGMNLALIDGLTDELSGLVCSLEPSAGHCCVVVRPT